MSVCVCGRAKASPIWHCGNICEYVRASEQRLVWFGALVPQVLPSLREVSSKSLNFSDLREWSEIPYESVNVYFSSAERSDIDEKCFLVHHISCVYCTHPRNVAHYSRLVWPLTSRLQAAFPPTHPLLSAVTSTNFSFISSCSWGGGGGVR